MAYAIMYFHGNYNIVDISYQYMFRKNAYESNRSNRLNETESKWQSRNAPHHQTGVSLLHLIVVVSLFNDNTHQ